MDTKKKIQGLQTEQEETIASVQFLQEIGGLVGRFVLAWLAIRIVSRRKLLWMFQVPGLLIIPLVYFFPAAGNLPRNNLEILRAGMFFVGFFTVAQFSFWGNYLPRVYPMHLRGTGESFAANVGGRMVGTGANFLTTRLAPIIMAMMPTLARPSGIAYAAAIVGLFVYALGTMLTCCCRNRNRGDRRLIGPACASPTSPPAPPACSAAAACTTTLWSARCIAQGHDALLIPTYTPITTDEVGCQPATRIFFGGINVFLQQKSALFRKTPWFLDRLLDGRGCSNGCRVSPSRRGRRSGRADHLDAQGRARLSEKGDRQTRQLAGRRYQAADRQP